MSIFKWVRRICVLTMLLLSHHGWSAIVPIDETPEKLNPDLQLPIVEQKTRACRRQDSRDYVIQNSQIPPFEFRRRRNFELNEARRESAQQFIELEDMVESIVKLDEALRSGQVEVAPWSGDYWGLRYGGLAKRYMDPLFPAAHMNTWLEARAYYEAHPTNETSNQFLSPSEKYDLFVTDSQTHLTSASWSEGKEYQDKFGDVEAWMGLCHGWAPASFMERRPTKAVVLKNLKSTDGSDIKFLPDDIKALLSLKWAKGINVTEDLRQSGTRFLGSRCEEKDPQKDPDTGRIIDEKCFDLNPGTWHMVVTNQIGRAKRPFIIDAAFDNEVWNQPVVRYSYSYFNPQTSRITNSLSNARVRLDDPSFNDTFKKFRTNPSAVEVVGVKMMLTYVVETVPVGRETDGVNYDAENTVIYYYDLELDQTGNIVGGEWYQNKHPDFIWMPVQNSVVLNQEDLWVHDGASAIALAPYLSQVGAPLRYVLDQILNQLDVDPNDGEL